MSSSINSVTKIDDNHTFTVGELKETLHERTSAPAQSPTRIVTHWRRFQTGLRRVSRGDITHAYSAATLPKVSMFTHDGRWFTNCGSSYSKLIHVEVRGYQLIPADAYRGAENVPYSYEGQRVTYKGKSFRLGTEILFTASDPTIDEWRQLLRSVFADSGLFTSGCTYPEFLTGRHAPDSENGRAASAKEIADCDKGVLPAAKDAMREWLDAGAKSLSSPIQQFALSL